MANQYAPTEASHADLPNVKAMLSDPAPKFFDELTNEISKSSSINERWKLVHIYNCRRLRTEMYENHLDFIQNTKSNIEKAKCLANDDEGNAGRKALFESWNLMFSATTTRAKLFERRLTAILKEISDQDKQFSTNHPIWTAAGFASFLFGACLGGVIIAHYVPTCGLLICGSMGAVAVCPPLLGVLAVTLLFAGGFLFYQGLKKVAERTEYERTRSLITNWAVGCCLHHAQLGVQDNCDDQTLEERIREGICQMKVHVAVWYSNVELDTFLDEIIRAERKLNEDHKHDKETDTTATAPIKKKCTIQ